MRKGLFLLAGLFILAILVGLFWVNKTSGPSSRVCNPGEALPLNTVSSDKAIARVEVASTGEEKNQGLSGRNCLDPDSGMLFTYDHSGDYCYWMKDMKFAIDMIWLDDEKRIVTIKDRVGPDTYPESFCPSRPAKYVVEVAAGKAAEYGWQIGTALSF